MRSQRRDRYWLVSFAILVIILTTIPYFRGFSHAGSGWEFTGFVFGVEDGNSYIAKMLRGQAGDWLFRSPYSSYPQRGALAFVPYLLLGKLAAGPELHVQLVILFHLFRWTSIALLVMASARFYQSLCNSEFTLRWSVMMAILGGGFGWSLLPLTSSFNLVSPLGLYSPEAFGFLSAFGLSHLVLARALMLFGLMAFLQSSREGSYGWKAGGFLLLLGFVQPLTVLTTLVLVAAYSVVGIMKAVKGGISLWQMTDLRPLVGAVLPPLPLLLYLVVSFSSDPYLASWTAQNIINSPHPLYYVIAYSLLLFPALAFMFQAETWRRKSSRLLAVWVLLFPFLAYAPHNLQRRLPDGVWIAWIGLAVLGIQRFLPNTRTQRLILLLILLLSLPSTAILLMGGWNAAALTEKPLFRPEAEVNAFLWMRDHLEKDAVVLSSYETGNVLPAWVPMYVVVGHGPETKDLEGLHPRVVDFFHEGTPDRRRVELLRDQGVDYLFVGPAEKSLGGFEPEFASYTEVIYDHEGYLILAVQLKGGGD